MQVRTNNSFTKRKPELIKLNLDLRTYDILCRYMLQSVHLIRIEHIVNLRKLLSVLDPSTYENDPEKMKRINFLNKAIEARVDKNVGDRDLILTYVNGGLTFKIDFLDYDHIDLSEKEISMVSSLITEALQYSFMYSAADRMQDILTRFKTSDYNNRGNIVREYEAEIDRVKNEFRKVKLDDDINDVTFSLRNGVFENAITNTWNLITSPSRRLMTGMQGLNEMIGGGFESGRVYMFLGVAGVGKSITLLNLLYQIKNYNIHYRTKDPTKTPCIVLLTMENTVVETITRLFDLVIESSKGMANYELDDVINKLRTEGKLCINDSSPIDIVIKYKRNKSVNTSYLYTLYDDLSDDSYEPIVFIQDHIKRIRSVDFTTDLRLELGDIVNEFKVFAADKDIPMITVSHLNREATKILEEAMKKGNQDNGKLIGRSTIGESLLMVDNLDCGITLTKDWDRDGNCYMTFNRIKMRDKGSTRDYIAQPFLPGSEIRLIEDVGGIPQFKESIHNLELRPTTSIRMSGASSLSTPGDTKLIDVIDLNTDTKDNVFNVTDFEPTKEVIELNPDNIGEESKNFEDIMSGLVKSLNLDEEKPAVYCPVTFGDKFDTVIPEWKWN